MRPLSLLICAVLLRPVAARAIEPLSDKAFLSAVSAAQRSLKAPFESRRGALRASQQEEEALLLLLRDRDASVRRSALKALKNYVSRRASTRGRILAVLNDSAEEVSVKHEAIKTLSMASANRDVFERLLEIGRRDPVESLRVIAYKALYWQALSRSDVRERLLDAAKREPMKEVRKAALWALFLASVNSTPRELLINVALRERDPELRVEALKSLFGAMGTSDARATSFGLARDANTAPAVRYAAILLLANRHSSDERVLLEQISRRDADPKARGAAITALGGATSEEIIRYFHLVRRDGNGIVVGDPLDNE